MAGIAAGSNSTMYVWLGVALLGVGSVVAVRTIDTQRQTPPLLTATTTDMSAHCVQFIALARAAYGESWRVRLDPRDPVCAEQIRQEWASGWVPRETIDESEGLSTPITVVPVAVASPAPSSGATQRAGTYCLNVISLAKAKFGPDWSGTITPEESAACQEQIHKALGQ